MSERVTGDLLRDFFARRKWSIGMLEATAAEDPFGELAEYIERVRIAPLVLMIRDRRKKAPWPLFVTAGGIEDAARLAYNTAIEDVIDILEAP